MFRPALLAAAAATTLALGAAPAEASVLAPPTPIAQRGAAPGCTGAADNPVVLVGRRFNISQDQGCAQAAPVAPVSRRWPNLDECAAGPVVPVGTRHGNQDECAAEPVVRVGRRIRF